MVGRHHPLSGSEFEQTPGDGEGQGILVWSSPWGHKQLDTPERLNTAKGTGYNLHIRLGSITNYRSRTVKVKKELRKGLEKKGNCFLFFTVISADLVLGAVLLLELI